LRARDEDWVLEANGIATAFHKKQSKIARR